MLEPAERAAIDQLERRWLTCELEGRPADVLELCSDDVVWLPPGCPPIRGKDAVRAWLATSRDHILDITLTRVSVHGDGSGAHKIANFRTRYVPAGSVDVVTIEGWHLWVLRRDAQTSWLVHAVAWSLMEGGRDG